jgi:hypothetical protein
MRAATAITDSAREAGRETRVSVVHCLAHGILGSSLLHG